MEKTWNKDVVMSVKEQNVADDIDSLVRERQEKTQEIRKLQGAVHSIEMELIQKLVDNQMYYALNINWARLNRKIR